MTLWHFCFHARSLEPPFHTVEELLATGGAVGNETCIICVLQDVGGLRALGKLVAQMLLVIDRISKSGHHCVEDYNRQGVSLVYSNLEGLDVQDCAVKTALSLEYRLATMSLKQEGAW